MRTAIAIALGIVFGYAAHEASAGVEWMYGTTAGTDEAAPEIQVPADGRSHQYQIWDYTSGTYRWGRVQANPNGEYQHWNYTDGTYNWGRVDID